MAVSPAAVPAEPALPRVGLWVRVARNFWVRRAAKALFTVFVVITLTFFLIRLMPANPIEVYINTLVQQFGMPYAEARNQAAALFAIDLDAPLHLQYFSYMRSLLRGDLGTSLLSAGVPVSAIVLRFLPWTIFSVGTGLLISFTSGIGLGMIMAYRRESPADHILSALASVLSSVPNYLIAMMLVVFLGVQWGLVDIAAMRGSMSPGMRPGFNFAFLANILYHATLPILTYVITTIGTWMLTMKSSTVSTLGEDYVMVAKARGLSERRITTAYVGRNASLPLFTQLTIATGFIVGGSLLIESIFVYQGIGLVLLRSITQRDYPVMQGVFLIITASVIVANLLADVLYSRLDPRIKLGGGE